MTLDLKKKEEKGNMASLFPIKKRLRSKQPHSDYETPVITLKDHLSQKQSGDFSPRRKSSCRSAP